MAQEHCNDDKGPRLAPLGPERRHAKRHAVTLTGRIFRPQDNSETFCTLLDISANGAGLECTSPVSVGEAVIVYLERLGRFEGHIVTNGEGRVAVSFDCRESTRKRIADKIALLLSGQAKGYVRLRGAPRVSVPTAKTFAWSDGRVSTCEIADISLTGASLRTDARPPLNGVIEIGCSKARVVRYYDKGIGVEFMPGAYVNYAI